MNISIFKYQPRNSWIFIINWLIGWPSGCCWQN